MALEGQRLSVAEGWLLPERADDLAQLRQEYEAGGTPVADLYAEYGLSSRSLQALVRAGGWRSRRSRIVDREGLIGRLFYLLERKIEHLEKDMDENNAADAAELGRMVASLDKLIAIEEAEQGRRTAAPKQPSPGMLEIRAQVARRLAQFGK